MADNSEITAGIGTTVSTDDVGGVHYQRMKLTDGTADSSAPIPGSTAKGLYVDPHGSQTRISVVPVISTTIYAADDVVGGKITFANAARATGASCIVQSALLIDRDRESATIDLVLFDQDFTAFAADNAPADPAETDEANIVGVIQFNSADYVNLKSAASGSSVCQVHNIGMSAIPTGTSLFGQLVSRGTPTYAAVTDLRVILTILQD